MNSVRATLAAVFVAASLLACSPSPSASPSFVGNASAQQLCSLMPVARTAHDHAAASFAAYAAGDAQARASEAAAADEAATSFLTSYTELRPNLSTNHSTFGELAYLQVGNIQVVSESLGDPNWPDEDLANLSNNFFPFVSQSLGQVEAMAFESSPPLCPGGLPGPPLPTSAPPATNGPVPPGSSDDQEASALAVVGLDRAEGVELLGDDIIRVFPNGQVFLKDVSLKNNTAATIGYPFDLTILHWTGQDWEAVPCDIPDSASEEGICGIGGVNITNVQLLGANMSAGGDFPAWFWPTAGASAPGTYALVVPVYRSDNEYPDRPPTEAAVKIVTLTATP